MKNTLAFLLAASAMTGAFAQAPAPSVGAVQNVQGLATVSQGNTIGNVVLSSPVTNGALFVTTSTGSVVILLNNGCRVSLNPNQSVTINTGVPCAALVASVKPVAVVAASGASNIAGFGTLAGVAALAIILGNVNNGPLSGS